MTNCDAVQWSLRKWGQGALAINCIGDFYLEVVCEPFHLYIVWESWALHAFIITPHIVSSHLVFRRPTLWSTSHIRTWSWNREGSGLTSRVKRCWSWYKSRLFSSPVLAANPSILPLQSCSSWQMIPQWLVLRCTTQPSFRYVTVKIML